MNEHDLRFYRDLIGKHIEAMREAHDALRDNASPREKNNARAAIEECIPDLQQ